jgi:hypothetical protein
MLHNPRTARRAGATVVEAAIVLPIVFFVILALLIGGVGVFKYQEAAHIARQTARYASVHGNQYAQDNAAAIAAGTLPTVDKAYLTKYAQTNVITLDPSQLQVGVNLTMVTPGATAASTIESVSWDTVLENGNHSPYSNWTNTQTTPPTNVQVDNMVTVTVTYPWSPNFFGIGTKYLTATAVVGMSY